MIRGMKAPGFCLDARGHRTRGTRRRRRIDDRLDSDGAAEYGAGTAGSGEFHGPGQRQPDGDIRPTRYTFDPGARTNWHSHAGGQVIIVEQGRLRVEERGKPGREFNPARHVLGGAGRRSLARGAPGGGTDAGRHQLRHDDLARKGH